MVRKTLLKEVGRKAYTGGYIVKTTIRKDLQVAAQKALQKKLIEYDRRHGYRGPRLSKHTRHRPIFGFPASCYPENWTETLEKLDEIGNQEAFYCNKNRWQIALSLEERPQKR